MVTGDGDRRRNGRSLIPSSEVPDSINDLEATTVLLALHLLGDVLRRLKVSRLNIVVDNTSVRDTIAKGSSKSEKLNGIILRIIDILKNIGCKVTIRYIPSDPNPSDSISRGSIPDWTSLSRELATWMDKRQGEGATGLRSRVLL